MKPDIKNAQLYKWLKSKDESLAGRILHIRDELSKWLPYVAQFFPHYPSHGLDHSDRIIEQLSRLLFNRTKPVVQFSTAEVYCLLCAAYLHDMGMVVSPGDATTILSSEQWNAFIAPGGKGQKVHEKYAELRKERVHSSEELTAFLADQFLRYLIADFVRRDHHERGKTTLELHSFLRQLVDDGDSVAFETIGDLGVGHGLRDSELANESRFPEERDVFDGKVNVRFLARLLRIGDLLDMSSKRAYPMTAGAVGPLPVDAVPHWQQYSAKKHENITPKTIEFTFECTDQDAHRVLRDWFGWLETEVHSAGLEQMHAARHGNWKAPRCIVSSQAHFDAGGATTKPTVIIKPAANAKYTFHDWKLELDHDLVLQRLIHDVYDNPAVFVRELVQNALDATRCQMYADSASEHPCDALPERPTQFSLGIRERYPVSISFSQEDVELSPDGPTEKRAVITVEDRGTGMDEEIIRRYFLQVGRSYYQSNEFRERYKFAPTSRFGIGFLSVFAVSKDITVDTARRDDDTGKVVGIRLRLREPRNYLLTEPWAPFEDRTTDSRTGTRIRVVLNDWPIEQPLATLVCHWCVAVEVPIVVKEAGAETTIHPDRLIDKTVLAVGRENPDTQFVLRTFEMESGGVEGQVAVIAYEDAAGEGWCDCWPRTEDLGGKRIDNLPEVDPGYTALHGVRLSDPTHRRSQWVQRCDVRSGVASVPLARSEPPRRSKFGSLSRGRGGGPSSVMSIAASAVEETTRAAVEHHFANSLRAKGPCGIYYTGMVLSGAPVADVWRDQLARTVVTWQNGTRVDISVAELLALNEVIIAAWTISNANSDQLRSPMKRHPRELSSTVPIVSWSDTPSFSDERFRERLYNMNLVDVKVDEDLWLLNFRASGPQSGWYRAHVDSPSWVVPVALGGPNALHCRFLDKGGSYFVLLEGAHEVVQWLVGLRDAAGRPASPIAAAHVESCWYTAADAPYKVEDLLRKWDESPDVRSEFKPPKTPKGTLVGFRSSELYTRRTVRLDSP